MNVLGDEIVDILHDGGQEVDGSLVDRYVLVLKSGRCVELGESGVLSSDSGGLVPDPAFQGFLGQKIVGVEFADHWASCGLLLENRTILVMGSPAPYYFGMYATAEEE